MKLLHLQEERETADMNDVSCQVSCKDSKSPKKVIFTNRNVSQNLMFQFYLKIQHFQSFQATEIVLSVDATARNTLLDYKNAHELYLSANSMYFNNNQNKPWELVCW